MTKNHNSGKDTVLGRKDSPNSATEILDYAPEPKVHPDFMATITHLSARLYKLISLTSALAHPGFPDSLFQYHLLTNNQLDDLARYYDQVWPPTPESSRYPKPIQAWIGTPDEHTIDIETKRRRIGCFIGLTGCEDPPVSETCIDTTVADDLDDIVHDDQSHKIEDVMEREWVEALGRARDEDSSSVILPLKEGGH